MKRRVHPVPPVLQFHAASHGPLYRQVLDLLRGAILHGALPAGSCLPSTRTLAAQWGISRNTILHAYEELAIEGLIAGRTGSGTRVRGAVNVKRLPDPREILRTSQYPQHAVRLADPDGNAIHLHH